MFTGIVIVWLICCFLVGLVAQKRFRNPFGWMFVAFVISPILALIFLLALGEGDAGEVRITRDNRYDDFRG